MNDFMAILLILLTAGLGVIAWATWPTRRSYIQPEMMPGPKDWVLGNKDAGTVEKRLEACPTDGNHLLCPDCHQSSLLAGPSGGMSQNVACESCYSEFNFAMLDHPPLVMERMGKLCMARAQIYGIGPTEFAAREKTA